MIRSRYALSLFCFCFMSSALFCGEGQRTKKNRSGSRRSGQNNSSDTHKTNQTLSASTTTTSEKSAEETKRGTSNSPRNTSTSLSPRSSNQSISDEEEPATSLKRVDSSSTIFHTGQTSSSASSLTQLVQSTSTATSSSSLVTNTAPALIAAQATAGTTTTTTTLAQLAISTATGTSSSTVTIEPVSSGPAAVVENGFFNRLWIVAQPLIQSQRTITEQAIENNSFCDTYPTPTTRHTALANTFIEYHRQQQTKFKKDYLLRSLTALVYGIKHDIVILPQKGLQEEVRKKQVLYNFLDTLLENHAAGIQPGELKRLIKTHEEKHGPINNK